MERFRTFKSMFTLTSEFETKNHNEWHNKNPIFGFFNVVYMLIMLFCFI